MSYEETAPTPLSLWSPREEKDDANNGSMTGEVEENVMLSIPGIEESR